MLGWAEMLSEWSEIYPREGNQPQIAQTSRIFESFNVTPSSTIVAFANFDKNVASDSEVSEAFQSSQLLGKPMRWGMIPQWSNPFSSKCATVNVRIESIAEKPTFRSAWKHQQRCLIPMGGYYEWQTAKQAGPKQSLYITDKNVGGLVAAGLYEVWGQPNDAKISCTMITRPADSGLDSIHHGMPVLLDPQSAT
ncbi:MAG: putative SOS response-associated peptidase YedK [Polaribacter sp.]|jgi:putative SOS response-associated peptidase YedK